MGRLLGVDAKLIEHCNCNAAANCLNMSVCAATTGKHAFTIAAWNPLAHAATEVARVPVSGASWVVKDAAGHSVPSQVVRLDERTQALPVLYLNSHGMNATQKVRRAPTARLALRLHHRLHHRLHQQQHLLLLLHSAGGGRGAAGQPGGPHSRPPDGAAAGGTRHLHRRQAGRAARGAGRGGGGRQGGGGQDGAEPGQNQAGPERHVRARLRRGEWRAPVDHQPQERRDHLAGHHVGVVQLERGRLHQPERRQEPGQRVRRPEERRLHLPAQLVHRLLPGTRAHAHHRSESESL